MRLTRFSDNALRCLIYLGVTHDETSTVGDVASRMAMSEDHLLKVVRRLVRLGYVQTLRGRHGGIRLVKDPASIRLADVIRSTEDNLALVPCFADGASCPISSACTLARCLGDALQAFFRELDRYTLADLVRSPRRLEGLLRRPPAPDAAPTGEGQGESPPRVRRRPALRP